MENTVNAVQEGMQSAARYAMSSVLLRSKVARLQRRAASYDQKLKSKQDEIARLTDLLRTRGRIVRTDAEARAALDLICQRDAARREAGRLLALRDMALSDLDTVRVK